MSGYGQSAQVAFAVADTGVPSGAVALAVTVSLGPVHTSALLGE
jgi:hypothetical protein